MTTVDVAALYKEYEKDEVVVLPPGTHQLEVKSCSVTKNGNGVFPIFKVSAGADAGKRVLAGQQVLTENSASIFFRNMKGFGLGKEYFDRQPSFEQIAKDLVGRIVNVELTIEPYKGEDRNKIAIGGIQLVGQADAAGVVQQAVPEPAAPTAAPSAPAAPPAPVAPPAPAAAPPAPAPVAPVQAPPAASPAPAAPAAPAPSAAPAAPPAPPAQPAAPAPPAAPATGDAPPF